MSSLPPFLFLPGFLKIISTSFSKSHIPTSWLIMAVLVCHFGSDLCFTCWRNYNENYKHSLNLEDQVYWLWWLSDFSHSVTMRCKFLGVRDNLLDGYWNLVQILIIIQRIDTLKFWPNAKEDRFRDYRNMNFKIHLLYFMFTMVSKTVTIVNNMSTKKSTLVISFWEC